MNIAALAHITRPGKVGRATFSRKKFYQIIQQQNLKPLPQIPQNAILSKYLQLPKSGPPSSSSFKKAQDNKLSYSELLSGSPHGSILSFTHRNHEITLMSTNYFRVDDRQFHKVLYAVKPDAIVVQRRPEYHVRGFQTVTKGQDGIFSDRMYLEQLKYLHQHQQVSMRPYINALNKSKDDVLQQNPKKQILQQKGFNLTKNYSASYQVPLYLGEMPMRSYRQWLANTHTLMELQQIFKVVCQRLPRYKHLSFNPYQMATLIHPDIFLKINDVYMATIIQMLISSKAYKRIVGVFGIVQNQAVKHILQHNQALTPILQSLIPPKAKGSLVRDIHPLQIIQKHILLDTLFNGPQTPQIKIQHFHTTNAVIEKYGKETDRNTMMKFRYDKVLEYVRLMEEKLEVGQQEIKKEFVRETLRTGGYGTSSGK